MGVRKNAKFLSAAEQEDFVRACILMKADIVNPGAPAADRYSKWDEYAAIHRMIQNVNAPGAANVNFAHGGLGSYSFLSWHREFLYRFELQLQTYVPGVMLPYWDWTDPATIMIDTFLGPNGTGSTPRVRTGYFALQAPGTGINTTPSPPWWPVGLTGFLMAAAFGTLAGGLRRSLLSPAVLPTSVDVSTTLARTTYSDFQNTLEAGIGLVSGNEMHNGIHKWIGGHMLSAQASPADPIFYLHHCNIDRLWAMWQLDGHATLYPAAGARPQHGPTDAMYPWVGPDAALYTTNLPVGNIALPDFSAIGTRRNVDVLDHRALGYTYDTMPVLGISFARSGSMSQLTPDPMTGAGTVTKLVAVKQGVSAFLQDCETVQAAGIIYATAGIEAYRWSVGASRFNQIFPTPYGLIKGGTAYSKAGFDAAAAPLTAAGSSSLADGLQHVRDTMVVPPFAWLPADERRYITIFSDGLLNAGATLASIPDGSFTNTIVFAMGFGVPGTVNYPNLDAVVAKGQSIGFPQVFHGENAGAIDKFYSNALARAIGFTSVFDPVIELFPREHVHLRFDATSADDTFLLTAQGVDFQDTNWSYDLRGPDGTSVYASGMQHAHGDAAGGGHAGHGGRQPCVTARRGDGRLSLVLQRDSAPLSTWVGAWTLMVAYRAQDMSAMVMPEIGELMFPVTAGPVRGPRYARLLEPEEKRVAARLIPGPTRNPLDLRPGSTNNNAAEACSVIVNVCAQTRLRLDLVAEKEILSAGDELGVEIRSEIARGRLGELESVARLSGPLHDLGELVDENTPKKSKEYEDPEETPTADPAIILANLERADKTLAVMRDEQIAVVTHHGGPLHMHVKDTTIPGAYHLGVYVEGSYFPDQGGAAGDHDTDHGHGGSEHAGGTPAAPHKPDAAQRGEYFTRMLNISVGVVPKPTDTR